MTPTERRALARRLGVSPTTVARWVAKFGEEAARTMRPTSRTEAGRRAARVNPGWGWGEGASKTYSRRDVDRAASQFSARAKSDRKRQLDTEMPIVPPYHDQNRHEPTPGDEVAFLNLGRAAAALADAVLANLPAPRRAEILAAVAAGDVEIQTVTKLPAGAVRVLLVTGGAAALLAEITPPEAARPAAPEMEYHA